MKGLIVYSSRSGNTKKLAQALAHGLDDICNWTLVAMEEAQPEDVKNYDVTLVGAWVDLGYPNKRARSFIEAIPATKLGLFVTMGAMPDSNHGDIVAQHLEELLSAHDSLGFVMLPGEVDETVLERVRKMPPGVWPEGVLTQMVATGELSRPATNEEYFEAIDHFKAALEA